MAIEERIETPSIGFAKEEWNYISLSDSESIKGLLRFRPHFDLLYEDLNRDKVMSSNVDLNNQLEEVICAYASLDDIIKKAQLTDKQDEVMLLYVEGNTIESIAEEVGTSTSHIYGTIDTICEKIARTNEESWLQWVLINKKCVENRLCEGCGKRKPLSDDYFREIYRDEKKYYRRKCRTCENKRRRE